MENKLSWVLIVVLAILAFACKKKGDEVHYPHGTPGVYVHLNDGDLTEANGFQDANTVYADDEITFRIWLSDEGRTYGLQEVRVALRVYSPEGVLWTTIDGATTSEIDDLMENGVIISGSPALGSGADTIAFEGRVHREGDHLEQWFSQEILAVTIGPIDACDVGKQICIDRSDFPDGSQWAYRIYDPPPVDGDPNWDGVRCFTIGESRIEPLQVSLDCTVEGQDEPGTLKAGELITFRIRLNNNTVELLEGMSLGFRIWSPTNRDLSWTATTGWVSEELEDMFDGVGYLPSEDPPEEGCLTGDGVDTIGFAMGGIALKPGLPPGYDEVGIYVQIGPIDESFEEEQICIDSSWFRPSHPWLWDVKGPTDYLEPSWHDEPQCFEVVVP